MIEWLYIKLAALTDWPFLVGKYLLLALMWIVAWPTALYEDWENKNYVPWTSVRSDSDTYKNYDSDTYKNYKDYLDKRNSMIIGATILQILNVILVIALLLKVVANV